MDQFQPVYSCLLGVEGLVVGELRDMGAQQVESQNGCVILAGSEEMLAHANLCSRYSERVLVLLGTFHAVTFEQLSQVVKTLPREQWIGKKDRFPVKGHSLSSQLSSVPGYQSIIKKVIVERLGLKYRISWFEESGDMYQVQFLTLKDTVSVMLDTSDIGLHKCGCRPNAAEAPIKETLTASMAKLARLWLDSHVYDPFCGSGTILTESAPFVMSTAPGLQRSFAVRSWKGIDKSVWICEKARVQDLVRRDSTFLTTGYDIDGATVALTLENAKKAGVIAYIRAEKCDIRDFTEEGERGCVICSPPHGERLLDLSQVEELYTTMGQRFVPKRGWSYYIISPDEMLESCFDRPVDKRCKLYNGMIKRQLYSYYKV